MNSRLLFFFVLLLLLVLLGSCELPGRTNSSSLCSRAPVQSCNHQFEAVDNKRQLGDADSCQVKAANNTHQHLCSNQVWEKQETCNNHQTCALHLEVYRHVTQPSLPLYRTAFNLTISNPSLETRIRYSDALSSNFTFCVNITLKESLHVPNLLWYDCVFHNRHLEGQSLRLEYLIDNKYGLLAFKVPKERDLDRGFIYMHLHYTQQLLVTFQALPESEPLLLYHLIVCKWVTNFCQVEHQQTIDLKNVSSFTLRFKNLITVSVSKQLSAGNFSVRIEDPACIAHNNKVCYNTESPFFIIPEEDVKHRLFFPIFALAAAIITCAVLLYHRRANCYNYAQPCDCKSKPTLLLVHDSASSDSIWMEAASVFLRDWGGFDVWLDFLHIPQSQHKDPLRWYSDTIKKADIVAVVIGSSSVSFPVLDHRPTIYHHTFDLALELIASCISQRLRDKEPNVLRHFIVIENNQTSTTSTNVCVPNSCASFARFRIPYQIADLVNYVYRDRCECNKTANSLCNFTRASSRNSNNSRESFSSIYNRLRHRELPSTNLSQVTDVDVGIEEPESSSLLGDKSREEYRNQRREQLDTEFGPNVISVDTLETLNGERIPT